MNTLQLLQDIDRLGVPAGNVAKTANKLVDIQKKQMDITNQISELDPSSKDYEKELTHLNQLRGGIVLQHEAACRTLEEEIRRICLTELEKNSVQAKNAAELEKLDEKILGHLVEVWNILHQRHELAMRVEAVYETLSSWREALGEGKEPTTRAQFPWQKERGFGKEPWPADFTAAAEKYAARFFKKSAVAGPPNGEPLTQWFYKRY